MISRQLEIFLLGDGERRVIGKKVTKTCPNKYDELELATDELGDVLQWRYLQLICILRWSVGLGRIGIFMRC